MKKTILILVMIAACSISFSKAQIVHIEKNSKAQEWAEQRGLALETQTFDIGKFKEYSIYVYKYKDLNSGILKSCLLYMNPNGDSWDSIKMNLSNRYRSMNKNFKNIVEHAVESAFDKDEVDGFIKFIKTLQSDVFTSKPEIQTTYNYSNITGFYLQCNYDLKQAKWYCHTFVPPIFKGGFPSIQAITQDELVQLLSLFEQAKAKM